MYNPQSVQVCDEERRRNPRGAIDFLMTTVGAFASFSSVPQVIKIWNTHTVAGISLATELIALFAVVSWFFYGLYIRNKPLSITSGLSSLILGIVVAQIFFYS